MRLAKIAYYGYFNHTNGKSLVSGAQLPDFDDLLPVIQHAWKAAAEAVIKAGKET